MQVLLVSLIKMRERLGGVGLVRDPRTKYCTTLLFEISGLQGFHTSAKDNRIPVAYIGYPRPHDMNGIHEKQQLVQK